MATINLHRKKILDEFDSCIEKNILPFHVLTKVQCEIINMLEEINFWNRYAAILKKQLDNLKNSNSNSEIIL